MHALKTGSMFIFWNQITRSKQSISCYCGQGYFVFSLALFSHCRAACYHSGGGAVKEVTFCHSWHSTYSNAHMLWSPFRQKIAPPLCFFFSHLPLPHSSSPSCWLTDSVKVPVVVSFPCLVLPPVMYFTDLQTNQKHFAVGWLLAFKAGAKKTAFGNASN